MKLGIALNFSLESCLLHVGLQKIDLVLLSNLLLAAKLLIAYRWKWEIIPIVEEWREKCQHVMLRRNKLTAIKKGSTDLGKAVEKFKQTWMKFIEYWKRPQDRFGGVSLDVL